MHRGARGDRLHAQASDRPATAAVSADRSVRAATRDRDRTVAWLQSAYVEGRLTSLELSERVEQALAARALHDLDAVTADLPPATDDASDGEKSRSCATHALGDPSTNGHGAERGFRAHLTSYLLVMALLVTIWLLTTPGGYFWPVWPMLGWGIGLASHGLGARGPAARRRIGVAGR